MRNNRYLVFLVVSALMLFAAMSGGCGGSSNSGVPSSSMNSAWNGLWTTDSGGTATLTVNGRTLTVNVERIFFLCSNSNVEGDTGSTTASMAIQLSSEMGRFPMLYDEITLRTTRLDYDHWSATATTDFSTASLNITMDSSTTATITSGTFTQTGDFTLTLNNLALAKPSTLPNQGTAASLVNGTWMSFSSTRGGGFIDINNNGTHRYFVPSASHPVNAGLSFSNTNLSQNTTTIKGGLVLDAINTQGVSARFPIVIDTAAQNIAVKLEQIAEGWIYRVKVADNLTGYLLFSSATEADFIMNIVRSNSARSYLLASLAAPLTKVTSSEFSGNTSSLIGQTYDVEDCKGFYGVSSSTATAGLVNIDSGYLTINNVGSGQLTLDVSLLVNTAVSTGGSGTWPFTRTNVPLTIQSLGGGMYLGTASSSEFYGQLLMIPDSTASMVYGISDIRDLTRGAQILIGGMLVRQ